MVLEITEICPTLRQSSRGCRRACAGLETNGVPGAHVAAHVIIEGVRTSIGGTAPAHRQSFVEIGRAHV